MKIFTETPLSLFAPLPPEARMLAESFPAVTATATTNVQVPQVPPPPPAARIMPLARLAAGGRWRIEAMRALSEPLLLWITRGQGRITMGGTTRGYGTHNAVFIPAGVMHSFDFGAQTHGIALFFGSASDTSLPAAMQHLRIRENAPQTELTAILDAVQREIEGGRLGAERAVQHHLGLLGVWLERQVAHAAAVTPPQRPPAARRLAARYAALLEREFRSGHGVAEFAAELGVTPTHLSRVCRESCGRPASELLQDRRLYEARRLLAETTAPVRDIAAALGFTSAAYFTRAFHARTGKTPSAFRKGG